MVTHSCQEWKASLGQQCAGQQSARYDREPGRPGCCRGGPVEAGKPSCSVGCTSISTARPQAM